MSRLFFLVLIFLSFNSQADSSLLIWPNNWELSFSKVNLRNRNDNFGLAYSTDLKFRKWLDAKTISDSIYATVGLTDSGSLYHVVEFGRYKAARLLSGKRRIQDFAMTPDGRLLARDKDGQLLIFDQLLWARPLSPILIKQGFKYWAYTSLLLAGVNDVYLFQLFQQDWVLALITNGWIATSVGMSTSLIQAMRFDFLNQNPDGFFATGKALELSQLGSEDLDSLDHGSSQWGLICEDVFAYQLPSELREHL